MKKLLSIFILILILSNVQSQEIELIFRAAGAASTIDRIKAINMETRKSFTVSGTDTIILNSISTGNRIMQGNSSKNIIYPNPFNDQAILQYTSVGGNNIDILLSNSVGQVIARANQSITSGSHKFGISVKNKGIYIVSVIGNAGITSFKIICHQNNNNPIQIEYLGFGEESIKEKSQTFEEPELYHFMIYSGEYITKIADKPAESKTYDVEFMECYDNDKKQYVVVQIGNQWWMAENLAFNADSSWGYPPNVAATPDVYGRLYNWGSAKTNCPIGWHLPSDDEWEQLAQFVSDQNGGYPKEYEDWQMVGFHLKAIDGWDSNVDNGTDDYGFSGLPGGRRNNDNGNFNSVRYHGHWWSYTETGYTETGGSTEAWSWSVLMTYPDFIKRKVSRGDGLSVRCVRDNLL